MEKQVYNARAFVFDFDGTLVNSMPFWAKAMLNTLNRHNVSYPENVLEIITPLGLTATAKYFRELGLDEEDDVILGEINRELTQMYENTILAKDGVEECVKALKNDGRILAVLTASPHRWLDPCLERNGLTKYFDHVWSCEDFTCLKTDPKIYHETAALLGVDIAEMTFLDDNLNADIAAMKSGCGVIGVYDETGKSFEQEMKAATDGYIYEFSELTERVLG